MFLSEEALEDVVEEGTDDVGAVLMVGENDRMNFKSWLKIHASGVAAAAATVLSGGNSYAAAGNAAAAEIATFILMDKEKAEPDDVIGRAAWKTSVAGLQERAATAHDHDVFDVADRMEPIPELLKDVTGHQVGRHPALDLATYEENSEIIANACAGEVECGSGEVCEFGACVPEGWTDPTEPVDFDPDADLVGIMERWRLERYQKKRPALLLLSLLLACGKDEFDREAASLEHARFRGDIVVDATSSHGARLIELESEGILAIDLATRNVSVFSLWRAWEEETRGPVGLALSPSTGRLVAVAGEVRNGVPDDGGPGLIAVFDTETGDLLFELPVSKDARPINEPSAIALSDAKPNLVWIADREIGILEINLETEERRVLVDRNDEEVFPPYTAHASRPLIKGLELSEDGQRLWFTDAVRYRVLVVHLDDLEVEPVSVGPDVMVPIVGEGPGLDSPVDVKWDSAQERLLVLDCRGLMAVDPATGDRQRLAGDGVGSGPDFSEPVSVALYEGHAFVTDGDLYQIVEVDPEDGSRSVFKKATK